MADSAAKKSRKSNFSADEVDVLVDSVRAHYRTLYGQFAKRATNRGTRQRAWMDILRKVNGVSVEKRTLQEVKNKWKKCQYALKEKGEYHGVVDRDDGDDDVSWEDVDSMPLQERLLKTPQQEKPVAGASSNVLKSQPLSPTKLKVTRQSPKTTAPSKQQQQHVEQHPPSPVNEEMCLRWNSHHSNMQTAFPSILVKEQYVDCTLAAEGKTLKCHRLILSSCSPYFEEILSGVSTQQHPVLFMRDIPFWILKSLCDFMYAGEVHIFQNKLEELLTVAEALKIKGLAGKSTPPENQEENKNEGNKEERKKQQQQQQQQQQHHHHHQQQQQQSQQHHHQHQQQERPQKAAMRPSTNSTFESSNQDYENDDLLDPLDLLEPLYEEAAEEKKPSGSLMKPKDNKYQQQQQQQQQPVKKAFAKKLRKRKFSEQREPSPPPVFSFRKGTRSRPNVKIPKYYHTDYANLSKPTAPTQTDPLLDVDEIKTEPIDVEDNLIDYSDEENQYMEISTDPGANCDSPVVASNSGTVTNGDKFKKIKLSKPVISEVRSLDEATPSGGLEVIKITVHGQGGEEKKEEVRTVKVDGGGAVKEVVVEKVKDGGVKIDVNGLEMEPVHIGADVEKPEPYSTVDGAAGADKSEGSSVQPVNEEAGDGKAVKNKDVVTDAVSKTDVDAKDGASDAVGKEGGASDAAGKEDSAEETVVRDKDVQRNKETTSDKEVGAPDATEQDGAPDASEQDGDDIRELKSAVDAISVPVEEPELTEIVNFGLIEPPQEEELANCEEQETEEIFDAEPPVAIVTDAGDPVAMLTGVEDPIVMVTSVEDPVVMVTGVEDPVAVLEGVADDPFAEVVGVADDPDVMVTGAEGDDVDMEEMRTSCLNDLVPEDELMTSSLGHLEKEAMNVANAINMENISQTGDQAGPAVE